MKKLAPSFVHNERAFACVLLHEILVQEQNMEGAWEQWARKAPQHATGWSRHVLLTTLRYLGPIDAWIARQLRKPIGVSQAMVQHCLRLGVVQLVLQDEPPHAVVNEMVELTKRAGGEPLAGLVNAVLKKAAKLSSEELNATKPQAWLPKWWQKQPVGCEDIPAVLQSGKPPLDITVKNDAAAWAERLGGEVIHGNSVRLFEYGAVDELDGFTQGEWWVQDLAATLPVQMLGDVKGKRVLDLCAAPGGKTAQLCAAGAHVVALDRSKRRVKRLEENMDRLRFDIETVTADALEWTPEQPFDAILLDAPCSATGTFRRNPDVLWTRAPEMVQELAGLQTALLQRAAEWFTPNGVLVYAVCSLFHAEGEAHLAHVKGLEHMPITKGDTAFGPWIAEQGYMRSHVGVLADQGFMDGFFAARFTKTG